MKKLKYIVLILGLFSIINEDVLFGQDYLPVFQDRISFYTDDNINITSLKMDSVKQEEGQIFYTMPNIDTEDPFCINPFGNSWIGPKILILNEAIYFFNNNGDSIKLSPSAKLNDSWTAFINSDSTWVQAEVKEHNTMSFLGVSDSVKTIEFSVFDKDDTQLEWDLSSMKVILSKNYGFVKTLNFSLFPNLVKYTLTDLINLNEFELVGLSEPAIGIQNLKWFEVFDFETGDELHETMESITLGPPDPDTRKFIEKIDRYIKSSKYSDSLVYHIERKLHIISEVDGIKISESQSIDTFIQKIVPNPEFDIIPGQPVISNGNLYSNSMYMGDRVLKHFRPLYNYYDFDGSCGVLIFFDGCFTNFIYAKGLGGPYSTCEGGLDSYSFDENKLVYFRKGQEEWGTPLVINVGFPEVEANQAKVFPNPSNGVFSVEFSRFLNQDFQLRLVDATGKLLCLESGQSNGPKLELNISGYEDGLYFLLIQSGNEIQKFKIILRNSQ